MPSHHIQKTILQKLVESNQARFSELRPKKIDGNIFTYHLKALIKQKLVQKNADGSYCLTNEGKLAGIHNSTSKAVKLAQAHSIILISAEDNGKWLLRKRLVQPMFGKIGFMHGEPQADESVWDCATRILKYRTDLTAEFRVRGSGFITLTNKGKLESYSNFTLLSAHNLKGDLRPKDHHGENFWLDNPDFTNTDMIPSMAALTQLLHANNDQIFFADLEFDA